MSPSSAGSPSSVSSSVFSRVFTAEYIDGAGDKGSGLTTTIDVDRAFLNVYLRLSV